jgi:flagellar protein FlaG
MSAIDKVPAAVEEAVAQTVAPKTAKSPSPSMDDKVIKQSPSMTVEPKKETEKKSSEVDKGLLEKLVEELGRQYQLRNTSLNFSIDDNTKSLVVKVIDSQSEKIIRQIPPEEVLAIRKKIQELVGALYDKEA